MNWIDTAAVYGLGHSEEVVTQALASWPGPRPYVFTKCGLRWDAQGQTHHVLTAASIQRECEDSLRRLKVDTIDLYQIHWPVEDMKELEERWSTMAQLQREGKARGFRSGHKRLHRSPLCSRGTRLCTPKWSRRYCHSARMRESA